MTKLTFANRNVIVVNRYTIGEALPAKAPSLKAAAQIALDEIGKGITADCAAADVKLDGELKDVSFENGALLTIPADYDVSGYKQALEVVVKEIEG